MEKNIIPNTGSKRSEALQRTQEKYSKSEKGKARQRRYQQKVKDMIVSYQKNYYFERNKRAVTDALELCFMREDLSKKEYNKAKKELEEITNNNDLRIFKTTMNIKTTKAEKPFPKPRTPPKPNKIIEESPVKSESPKSSEDEFLTKFNARVEKIREKYINNKNRTKNLPKALKELEIIEEYNSSPKKPLKCIPLKH